jgi:aspartate 1-decarboxylase
MQVEMLKSKIHRAQITGGNLNYEGSLTIDSALMEKAGLLRHEKILASNLANGHRFETYAIPGEAGSGAIILNGATTHLGKPGDRLTIMSFAWLDAEEAKHWQPRVIVLGEHNKIINERGL